MENILNKLPFWASLTEQEKEILRKSAVIRRYEKGSFIHSSDRDCLGMLFILSGEIRTYILSDEGREITLFRLYPNDLCVLSASCVISQISFDTQMTARQNTEVLIIPPNITALLKEQNISVRCFLYEQATERFSEVMWAMQQLLFTSFDKRLAQYLWDESDHARAPVRATHEQIARDTGAVRETVTRMLRHFADDGIVSLGRGTVTVADAEKLRRLAGM